MSTNERLTLAVQKKGRLNNDSFALRQRCNLTFDPKTALFYGAENFPLDILLVKDDDIPLLVADGICDLGIVGENVLNEQSKN